MQKAKRAAIIVGVIVGILLIVGIVLAAIFNAWLDILYVVLILTALVSLAGTAMLIYAVFTLVRTIQAVRNEVQPLISEAQNTMGVLQDTARSAGKTAATIGTTAQMTSDLAVAPTVRAAAAVVAGQQMVRVFFGKGRVAKKAERRHREELRALTSTSQSDVVTPVAIEGD